jgi:hypothetical protein
MAAAGEQNAAAVRARRLWRAQAAMGEVVRTALARAGVDAARAVRLSLADKAAAALAAIPDTRELQEADTAAAPPANRDERSHAAAFVAKITAMTKGFAGAPPDFANASFAELLAWSFTQREGDGARGIAGEAGAVPGESAGGA